MKLLDTEADSDNELAEKAIRTAKEVMQQLKNRRDGHNHLQQLRGLTHLNQLIEEAVSPCMPPFCNARAVPGASFSAVFNEPAKEGYDIVRGKVVDYGNIQYKSFLIVCSMRSPFIRTHVEFLASFVPTLGPHHEDSESSLCNQGDIVKTIYGIGRGNNFLNCRTAHEANGWRALYVESGMCFHAIDLLRRLTNGGCCKRDPSHYINPCKFTLPPEDSSKFLAAMVHYLADELKPLKPVHFA